jgi:hypothetical protein
VTFPSLEHDYEGHLSQQTVVPKESSLAWADSITASNHSKTSFKKSVLHPTQRNGMKKKDWRFAS